MFAVLVKFEAFHAAQNKVAPYLIKKHSVKEISRLCMNMTFDQFHFPTHIPLEIVEKFILTAMESDVALYVCKPSLLEIVMACWGRTGDRTSQDCKIQAN